MIIRTLIFLVPVWFLIFTGAANPREYNKMTKVLPGEQVVRSDSTEKPQLDVPYVPTPTTVIKRMLEIANVGPNDIVYDLGCGDGRIVIAAARDFGARGVGIDIDPERIKESRENASTEGVSDRVEFIQQDLFDAEIGNATVVTLYLLAEVNLSLRPKLLSELKPGTRIVSHSFNMGDWEPEYSEKVDGQMIYYWTIPAK